MDFIKLKDNLLASSTSNIEKVEVNQRHLIDKILARYSAEFTIYRELIQNANDAGASEIQINFMTSASENESRDSKTRRISAIVIRNNGRVFTADDWNRLKKIAEGNPDEQKIGFFGVGFYSLFSICEEPLVISGATCMGFYWDGNQLYTKSAPYADNLADWTCICLQLREPLDLPDYDNFGVFLCKSLLFTYSLSTGSFSVDDKVQLRVNKTLSPLEFIKFAKSKSSSGLFTLKTVESRIAQLSLEKNYKSVEIDADKSSPFSLISGLWRLAQIKFTDKGKEEAAFDIKLRQPGTYHAFLKLFQSTAIVKASRKLSDEMERTTKKKPFSEVKIDMIYVNWEQLNAIDNNQSSDQCISLKHPILSQLLPFPNRGKVFIGFETHQTSGIGIHLTAPFIPTVERESIDFVDGCLKIWNVELLQLSGHLCRIIYEEERKYILKNDPNYLDKSRHLMEAFNFQESTPLGLISWTLFQDFLNQEDLFVPSSTGFVSIRQLRLVPEDMRSFVCNIPRVPDEISTSCEEFLKKLSLNQHNSTNSSISIASVTDVINFELKSRKLTELEIVSCLKWWIKTLAKSSISTISKLNQQIVNDFSSALLVPSASAPNEMISLSSISFYACEELSDLFFSEKAEIKYFPIDCLSPTFSAQFPTSDLSLLLKYTAQFFNYYIITNNEIIHLILIFRLQELNVAEWLGFIYRSTSAIDSLESNVEKSEQFLVFLSKYFSSLAENELVQSKICSYLTNFKCIPVGEGQLRKPSECFFEDVPRLQTSMNILKFSTESRRNRVNEDMLKGAGVRSHLPLEQIFANIDKLKWDHCSLLKYLAKIKAELSRSDFEKIRTASIFPDIKDTGLFRLPELYSDNVGDLVDILDLKQMKWKDGKFCNKNRESDVGDLLAELGFNFIIPWRVLLSAVLKADSRSRIQIYNYFFKNYSNYRDFRPEIIDFPFILADSEASVFLPNQVFLDPPLNHLGFYLIHPDLREYAHLLGVKERPSSSIIAAQLIKSRFDIKISTEVFSYCTAISYEFTDKDWKLFRQSAFIPIKTKGEEGVYSYKTFDQVFFPSTNEKSQFSELFDHVDFGSQGNAFLKSVGVSDEPQLDALIKLLLKDPSKLLLQLKPSKYIELMERLSLQWQNFSKNHPGLVKALVSSKSFIGTVKSGSKAEVLKNQEEEAAKNSSDSDQLVYSLYGINDVFLVDDTIAYQLFNVPTVPSNLDQFYIKLGCRWISSIIRSEWKYKGQPDSNGPLVKDVRNLLNDRLELIITSLEGNEDKNDKIQKGSRKKFSILKIYEVDSIKIHRKCSLNSQEDSQTACCFSDYATSYPSIYLARNLDKQFDYFDLATVVVTLLCDKRGRLQDSLLVASLLTTPLSSLKAKGFFIKESSKVVPDESRVVIDKTPEVNNLKPEHVPQMPPSLSGTTPLSNSSNELTLKNNPLKQSPSSSPSPSNSKRPPTTPNSPLPPLPSQLLSSTPSLSSNEELDAYQSQKKKWSDSLFGFLKKSTESLTTKLTSSTTTALKTGTAGEGRNEESLRHALDRGIKSLRPHGSNNFTASTNNFDENQNEPAPNNSHLKRELSSYCQIQTSLKIIGTLEEGVNFFASESISSETIDVFLSENREALMLFYELIIVELSKKVFKIPTGSSTVHFFYDSNSPAVAFNRAHSLFFNFAYFFSSRHHEILSNKSNNNSSSIEIQRCKAFWFMTFCHELAHNFVSEHDSQHEFYLSSFAETYLPDFLKLIQ